MKLETILQFIRAEGKSCFTGWTDAQIGKAITEGIEDRAFVVDINAEGSINGIVLGIPCHEAKLLHITGIIIRDKSLNTMNNFISYFKSQFNGYTLEAQRHKKLRKYKTTRLLQKLS